MLKCFVEETYTIRTHGLDGIDDDVLRIAEGHIKLEADTAALWDLLDFQLGEIQRRRIAVNIECSPFDGQITRLHR